MATPNEESVQYNIDIQATQALLTLKNLTTEATTTDERIKMLIKTAKELQSQFGGSMKDITSNMKEIDQSLTGILNNKGWNQLEKDISGTGQAGKKAGDDIEQGFGRPIRAINLLRIALGALVAMVIFNVIQAFQQMVQTAINGMRKLELATTNLVDSERKLSEAGVEITPKDLDSFIKKLQQLDPLLSKLEATQAVSDVATRLGTTLNLSKEQMDSFLQSMTVLAVKARPLGKDFSSVMEEGVSAVLSGRVSKGLNDLGVAISDDIVKTKAWKMGLVESADAYDKLSGNAKKYVQAATIIQILQESTQDTAKHLPEYFKGADSAFGIFQAKLTNVLTDIGQQLAPLLIKIFTALANWLQKVDEWLTKNQESVSAAVTIAGAFLQVIITLVGWALKFGTALGWVAMNIVNATDKMQKFIDKHPMLKKMLDAISGVSGQSIGNYPDTSTNPNAPNPNEQAANENKAKAVADAETKIQAIMQDAADKKLGIETDYGRKLEDIARNYSQKLEDIARDTANKREDALRAYNQKVEDINRQADQQEAQAKQDARQKEIDREKEYQQKLKELREKFLMDLEDALRARDARQVLRLIRQYNLDKQNLADRQKLDQQQAKRDLANKLQQIEQDRQLKLQAAKREYDDKLQEIAIGEQRAIDEANIWRQRQTQDANTWYQRQLADYRLYLQQKLRDLAQALMKEYQLTAAGAAAIFKLLGSYFGTGGSISQLLGNSLTSNVNGILSGSGSGSSGAGAFPVFTPNGGGGSGGGFPVFTPNGYAEGGTLIATRPTKAIFGENGPEKVDITPLGKPGNNVGRIFGDKSAMGMGGNVHLRLELSPDLQAKIIDSSLENLSVHIERINRSKS